LLIASIITTSTYAAAVRSLSREQKVELDGKTFVRVSVTCFGISEPRVIQREKSVQEWCAKDVPSMCFSRKMNSARKVCGARYNELLNDEKNKTVVDQKPSQKDVAAVENLTQPKSVAPAVAKPAGSPNRAELVKERLQIKEQRVLLEQQRLELEKRELELQKRELQLNQKT